MKIIATLSILVLSLLTAKAQTKNFIDQPYIEVSGSADTLVTPNEIYIRIIISEKDTRDKVSIEESEEKMFLALKEIGVDTEKALTTSDMSSNFKFYLLKNKDIIKTKKYSLMVSDATEASRVFLKLEEIGISNVAIERVDHSDIKRIENIVRTNAILNAKEKAGFLTKPLNQNVGAAIHITENESGIGVQLQGQMAGIRIRGANSISRFQKSDLREIEFEKIKVEANVNAIFLLK